jgi:predicted glycoside hydrolase/deacetylase ChbG (UPF0249 family)
MVSAKATTPRGLLVVNADDWGGWNVATDRIALAWDQGVVSSTTAMVHMADSCRAADIAWEVGIPLGLHLNFTQPFDAPDIPATVRERQRALCERFTPLDRRMRLQLDPRPSTATLIRDGILDQFDAFRTTYGAEPTHLDSHQHVHTCPDVFTRIPSPLRLRRSLSYHRHLLTWRFTTTSHFAAISRLHPDLGGDGLERMIARSATESVEIMVHPSFAEDLPILLSDGWREALRHAPLGSFADLALEDAPATAVVRAAPFALGLLEVIAV